MEIAGQKQDFFNVFLLFRPNHFFSLKKNTNNDVCFYKNKNVKIVN